MNLPANKSVNKFLEIYGSPEEAAMVRTYSLFVPIVLALDENTEIADKNTLLDVISQLFYY